LHSTLTTKASEWVRHQESLT